MNIHQTPEPEYIVIPDEDGNDNRFEILFTFEEDETGRKYMLVVPADEDVDDEEERRRGHFIQRVGKTFDQRSLRSVLRLDRSERAVGNHAIASALWLIRLGQRLAGVLLWLLLIRHSRSRNASLMSRARTMPSL